MKNTTIVNMEIAVSELNLHQRITVRTELAERNSGYLNSLVENKPLLFNMLNHTSVWVDRELNYTDDVNFIAEANGENIVYYDKQYIPSSNTTRWDIVVDHPMLTRKECHYMMAFLPDSNTWCFAPLHKDAIAQVKYEELQSKLLEEQEIRFLANRGR